MAIGVVGRKAGMTRIFTDEGQALPVTVIEVDKRENNKAPNVRATNKNKRER